MPGEIEKENSLPEAPKIPESGEKQFWKELEDFDRRFRAAQFEFKRTGKPAFIELANIDTSKGLKENSGYSPDAMQAIRDYLRVESIEDKRKEGRDYIFVELNPKRNTLWQEMALPPTYGKTDIRKTGFPEVSYHIEVSPEIRPGKRRFKFFIVIETPRAK